MPKDTGKKLADMLYGQPFDVPTPENLRLGQQMIERELREKAARDAKLTPLDKAKAAYEAAKMMGSAAVAGLGSIPTRIAYGPEAAEKYIANRISIPESEKGMDYVQNVGDFLEQLETKYKLPPILPEAIALQYLSGPATKQAVRAAKKKATQSGEKAVRLSDNPDVMQLELAGGGLVKGLAKAVGKAAEAAGQKAPVLAEKELTTLQDTHTMLGDRVRAGVMDAQKMMEGFDYKYDKGQRVFTKDSAGKNKPPYTILNRTRVGNQVMRQDHPEFGPGMGKPIIDPETGRAMRTPYEPGYRVRMERGPDDWSEFEIPQSAIAGDVEMATGGAVSYAEGGEITADDLILEERKL